MRTPRLASLIFVPVLATLTITACAREPASPPPAETPTDVSPPAPITAVLRSWTALEGPDVPRSCELIEDDAAWAATWARAGEGAESLPSVDFAAENVIAVFHGVVRAIEGMDAVIETDDDTVALVYQIRGTSGVLSPEVHPWGFYVVPRPATHVQIAVECHHRAGPGPAEITHVATLTATD